MTVLFTRVVLLLIVLPAHALADVVWAGGAALDQEFIPLVGTFSAASGKATFELPGQGGLLVKGAVEQDGDRLSFALSSDQGIAVQMDCRLRGEFLIGKLSSPDRGLEGTVSLVRTATAPPDRLDQIAGAYILDAGPRVQIKRARLGSIEVLTGSIGSTGPRQRTLYPLEGGDFLVGEPGKGPGPEATRLVVPDLKNVTRITFVDNDGSKNVARRVTSDDGRSDVTGLHLSIKMPEAEVRREDIWLQSGNVRLRATLLLPPGAGPHPAAVLVHGSAPSTRSMLGFHINLALNSGLAVLAYDKRGCGESAGTFEPFSVARSEAVFSLLARDAVAAFRYLRERDEIDASRIGLVGGSQAGWIMPLAATREPGVAFVAATAGCAVSAGEEERHGALVRQMPLRLADQALESFDGPRGFDPRDTLAMLSVPMLWLFGDRDLAIPTRASLVELDRLVRAGHANHTVHVYADCNHNFVHPDTREPVSVAITLRAWLLRIGILDPS